MKKTLKILLFSLFISPQFGNAQDLSNFDTVAHYSLLNTAADLLDLQDTIALLNAPYSGSDGVYSNGKYIGSDLSASFINTPNMAALYADSFAVQLEFKLESLNSGPRYPVIICGDGWRYLGLEHGSDNNWMVIFNNLSYAVPDLVPEINKWYTLTLIHNSSAEKTYYYLDGMKIAERTGALDRPSNDGNISNTNGGSGNAFKGNWRNLKVFGASQAFSAVFSPSFDTSLSIHPNPASWGLEITVNGQAVDGLVNVYTTEGKRVLSKHLKGQERLLLFPANIKAGVYFLVIQGAGGQLAHRRVVIKP